MSEPALYLGWRVAILGSTSLQLLLLAAAIATQSPNARANRLLTAFLIVLVGVVAPYTLGYAGAYDAWRGLTFAPLAIPLALPPLLYAYTHALVRGRRPDRFGLHLGPPLIQFGYFVVCFALPPDAKWDWYTGGHRHLVGPAFDLALLVSLGLYAASCLRLLAAYRRDLAEARSDDDRFATGWLTRVIVALVAVLAVYAAFTLWDWLSGGIDFFQETGLYLALVAIGLYLGIEGWRHATLRFPVPEAAPPDPVPAEPPVAPDWRAVATGFDTRLREAGWASEPDLSLPVLARRLATNTGRLSRAINLGLGVNFSAWINGVRAEAVASALDGGSTGDLLTLAFDAGFSSKASFNRAFQARFGVAPSRYRRHVSHHDFPPPGPEMRRAAG
ncbi:AraC family transcriptional regulator [Brevundimonas subvibrioides]|uniref:Helix-turn-helix-domain containing protein AraC type n=1 Tax=Brevundimonas subvibrioides (strain ATCC 15264 / DSM 4735 / LMG 14903 / NBRC 16000 / CB 81) TaxID=633149 RepID=D9QFC6_BRESC|nr:helix-turn-helix domain-containing protein [Brevundimonas subvibrioides]ADL02441.1 helix-turn-helix- domain containing protein AraC type [Brevundimonas subvibrioides ATCC 15264]